jgi:hypothetical protein
MEEGYKRLKTMVRLFLRYADSRFILVSSFGSAIMFLAIGKVAQKIM